MHFDNVRNPKQATAEMRVNAFSLKSSIARPQQRFKSGGVWPASKRVKQCCCLNSSVVPPQLAHGDF